MIRAAWVVLVGAALCLLAPMQAQEPAKEQPKEPAKVDVDKALAGNWKVTLAFPDEPSPLTLWLVKFTNKDKVLGAEVLATNPGLLRDEDPAAVKISEVAFKEGVLTFSLKMPKVKLDVEVKIPADDSGKMLGSAMLGANVIPAKVERTTIATLDSNDLAKEIVAQKTDALELMPALSQLIRTAEKSKAKPEEVRAWVDKGLKAAEAYGPRYHRAMLVELTDALVKQDGYSKIAVAYAKRAERSLTPKDSAATQERVLKVLQSALEAAGEKDEAKAVTERIAKIDKSVRAEPFPGRTGKSDRVVVVELFTGAECPPCVAADMGFDALNKTFKPKDVVLLQYHQHIPGPDPLTNKDSDARMKYYAVAFGRQVRGTPTILFNGEPQAAGGGGKENAQEKYEQYMGVIKPLLEKESRVKLTATAKQKGDSIEIKAEVADLKDTGDSTKLRFVLVEDTVNYKGGNGLAEHHCVVRAMPGGVDGVSLKEKTFKGGATVDLAVLKKDLQKYVADYYKDNGEDPPKETPLELKNLRVIALIQDDNTREILQAVQVAIEAAK